MLELRRVVFFVDIGDNLLERQKPVRNVEKSVKIYS
mgnify:CR=1 FL=1